MFVFYINRADTPVYSDYLSLSIADYLSLSIAVFIQSKGVLFHILPVVDP